MIDITITLSDLQKQQKDIFEVIQEPYPLVVTALTTAQATTYINDKISTAKSDITDFITMFTSIKDYDDEGDYIHYTSEILNINTIKLYVIWYILYLTYYDLYNRKVDLKPLSDLENRKDNSNYEKLAYNYEAFIRNPETKKMNQSFLMALSGLKLPSDLGISSDWQFYRG